MSSDPPPETNNEPAPGTNIEPPSGTNIELPSGISSELPPVASIEPSPDIVWELPPDTSSEPQPGISSEATQPVSGTTLAINSQPPPPPLRRASASLLIRLTVEGLLGLLLVGLVVFSGIDQRERAIQLLASQVAAQKSQLTDQQSQIAALQAEVKDLKERWFGSPALYSPPAIANTNIEFFDVTGSTQQELLKSLNASTICTQYGGCAPDPAVPNGVAWGLEGFKPAFSSYQCYSPSTTTIPYTEFMVLPRWSPPSDGSVKIPLVQAWNALAQVVYTHEAGHVAITQQDIAALNDQAHQQPSCAALISFWASPSVFDKIKADQDAYHARLHADCRPEIGCLPPGYMGW